MLEIDKNSYVDIDWADNYVKTYYFKFSPLRVIWSVLDKDEKVLYLLNSMQEIESLPICGIKHSLHQVLQFPRMMRGVYRPFMIGISQAAVPLVVKQAQVENAIGIINAQCHSVAAKQFATLSSIGAVKNTKLSRREMGDAVMEGLTGGGGGGGAGGGRPGMVAAKPKLTSEKALKLLRPFMGGFSV